MPSWLTPVIRARLGVDSDAAIARVVGVSTPAVQQQRALLGIPAVARKQGRGKVWNVRLSPQQKAALDAEAARRGCTPSAVVHDWIEALPPG